LLSAYGIAAAAWLLFEDANLVVYALFRRGLDSAWRFGLYPIIRSTGALLAAALGMLVVVRAWSVPSNRLFALSAALYGVAWVDEGRFALFCQIQDSLNLFGSLGPCAYRQVWGPFLYDAASTFGLAALVRWTQEFPRRLSREDVEGFWKTRSTGAWLKRLQLFFGEPSRVWLFLGWGLLLLLTVIPSGVGIMVRFAVMLPTCAVCITNLLAASSAQIGEEQTSRLRWVFAALGAAAAGGTLALVAEIPVHVLGTQAVGVRLLHAVLLPVTMALFPALLGFAVLRDGLLSSSLVVRRTAVYGASAVVVVFLFGALETVLADLAFARVGIGPGAGAWLAGGSMALAFRPLHSAVSGGVSTLLDRQLPANLLADAPRHQAAIVFSDIVGYTALTSESEEDALTMMSVFHRQARRAAAEAKGRLVKSMGDGVLMEFEDPAAAVDAVRELTVSFRAACEPLGLPEMKLRSGVHFGEVAKRRDGDVFGDAVNIASRLEAIAAPGQIVVSRTVADQLDHKLEDLGERKLKNVPEPVECWGLSP
jgi:class 3 adenylate cyclase